jgi:hypothetical protein
MSLFKDEVPNLTVALEGLRGAVGLGDSLGEAPADRLPLWQLN